VVIVQIWYSSSQAQSCPAEKTESVAKNFPDVTGAPPPALGIVSLRLQPTLHQPDRGSLAERPWGPDGGKRSLLSQTTSVNGIASGSPSISYQSCRIIE